MEAVIYGFGPIGRLIAQCCVKKDIDIIGAVDINPELVGKSLRDLGVDSDGVVKDRLDFQGDIAFLCTGSFLDRIYPQVEECIKKGFNILSTCETLSYPYYRYPELSEKLNSLAKRHNKTILGSGINPGFLLDSLIVTLSAPFTEVRKITAVRSIDALKRREPFQKKVGVGMKYEEVEKLLKEGRITGHVGFAESILIISKAMGFKPDKVLEGQEIVRDENNDKVAGMKGFGSAIKGSEEKIRVEFHAFANAEEYEEVIIEGDNNIKWKSTGTKGDLGTASVIVNLAEYVVNHASGLITMADLVPFRPSLK